jgi:peptidoglycan/LPS O-acetylase OafA/YrhL
VQGLRAVAVALVVAFHSGLPLPGGFVGVDVFFVISGFVITRMLLRELAAGGTIDLGRFYARRVRRLLPALGLMLAVTGVLATLLAAFAVQRMTALTTAAASVFGANLYLFGLGGGYFDPDATLNPLLHTWSLAVEEQFYLVFPLAILLAWRAGGRRLAIVAVCGIAASSFELSATLSTHGGAVGRFAFYGSPTRAWEFGLGALLAFAPDVAGAALGTGLAAAGAILVDLATTSLHGTTGYPGTQALLPAGGAALLIAGGAAAGGPLARLLASRPFVYVGDRSYSWYLWHWPLIVFATALFPTERLVPVAAALASFAVAAAAYRVLEDPIRRGGLLPTVSSLRLGGVCVVVPLAAAVLLGVWHARLERDDRFASVARAARLHADVVRGCDSPTPLGARSGGRCTWAAPEGRGRVVLVGDSNAGHFTEPFVRAAAELGYTATVATFSSCPFAPIRLREDGALSDMGRCRTFVDDTVRTLEARKPSLVVIASRTDKYLGLSSYMFAAEDTATSARSLVDAPAAKAAVYARGLASALRALNASGVPVVLVHPVPHLTYDPSRCAAVDVLRSTCGATEPLSAVRRDLALATSTENAAASAGPLTTTADLEPLLCPRGRCSTVRDGVQLYRDDYHLSIDGAEALAPWFAALIREHARAGRAISDLEPAGRT